MKLYRLIATLFETHTAFSVENSLRELTSEQIEGLCREHMPSGSGFNSGTSLCFDSSKPDHLVFTTGFQHMSEHGMYEGWTDHSVHVTPSLSHDFDIEVRGPNHDDINDYIAETMHEALSQEL
jgi:hypothetical protein